MQSLYNKALTEIAGAAADCQSAISSQAEGVEDVVAHENTPMLDRAMSAAVAGAKDLYRATEKITTLKQP